MVFAEITDGVTTVYLVDVDSKLVNGELGGYEYSGQYYKPGLEKVTNFDFEGSPFVSLRSGSFEVDYSLISGLSGDELSCVIYLWDEYADTSRFKVFDGKIFKTDVIGVEQFKDAEFTKVRYRLRTDLTELSADLLTSAPDLKQVDTDATTYNDGRVYPMTFGYVKYITPLALAVEVAAGGGGQWYSEKECTDMYDAGINVQYLQSGTTVTKTGVNPVYGITIDARADSSANGSDSSSKSVRGSTKTFRQASAPSAAAELLIEGDEWIDSDNANARYRWDGSSWVSVVDGTIATAQSTADGKNTIYRQTTEPPSGMNTGDIWIDTDDNNKTYQYSGLAWVDVSTDYGNVAGTKPPSDADNTVSVAGGGSLIHIVANGSNSTATRLTVIGGTAPSSGLTSTTRLTFTSTLDGQTHFYKWNGSDGWTDIANLGETGFGGDSGVLVLDGSSLNAIAGYSNKSGYMVIFNNERVNTDANGVSISADGIALQLVGGTYGANIESEDYPVYAVATGQNGNSVAGYFRAEPSTGIAHDSKSAIQGWNDGGSTAVLGNNEGAGASVHGDSSNGTGVGVIGTGNSNRAPFKMTGQTQPANAAEGDMYFNSVNKHFYGYNGTSWVQLDN